MPGILRRPWASMSLFTVARRLDSSSKFVAPMARAKSRPPGLTGNAGAAGAAFCAIVWASPTPPKAERPANAPEP